jgi:hypothetical protein
MPSLVSRAAIQRTRSVVVMPGGMSMTLWVRHEALFDRTGVKGPRRLAVAAAGLKLEEA